MNRLTTPALPATFISAVLATAMITSAVTYAWIHSRDTESEPQLVHIQKELADSEADIFGHTQFTTYLAETKRAIEGQSKFLAAKVDREYVQVEHIQKSTLGIPTEATVVLKYAVAYSFGYDLRPEAFSVTGDAHGITVNLHKPELVASPAVHILAHNIPSSGFFIDEQAAVIALQQQLFSIAKKRASALKNDPAVIALCESQLAEFLHGFLAKQPNVGVIPTIKFAYK